MAEIKIEKEKTIWPWVLLGVLLLGLLLYFFVFRNNDNAEDTAQQTMQNTTSQAALQDNNNGTANEQGAVAEYVAFVKGEPQMGLDHNYSNTALLRLANAVQAKAAQAGYTVNTDLDRVKELANQITQDPMATTHSNSINRAADMLATAMHNMQQAKFPALNNEAQEVKQAAQGIDSDVMTLEQKVEVKSFFDKAANLLQRMN